MDTIDQDAYANHNGTVTQWSIATLIADNTTAEWDVAMEVARAILTLVTTHTVYPIINEE